MLKADDVVQLRTTDGWADARVVYYSTRYTIVECNGQPCVIRLDQEGHEWRRREPAMMHTIEGNVAAVNKALVERMGTLVKEHDVDRHKLLNVIYETCKERDEARAALERAEGQLARSQARHLKATKMIGRIVGKSVAKAALELPALGDMFAFHRADIWHMVREAWLEGYARRDQFVPLSRTAAENVASACASQTCQRIPWRVITRHVMRIGMAKMGICNAWEPYDQTKVKACVDAGWDVEIVHGAIERLEPESK
jgi:hypothetical protein